MLIFSFLELDKLHENGDAHPDQEEVIEKTEKPNHESSRKDETEDTRTDIPEGPDQRETPDDWVLESQETLQDVYGGRDRSHIENAFKLSEPESSESK